MAGHLSLAPAPGTPDTSPLVLDDYLPFRLSVASNGVSRLIARAYEDRFGLFVLPGLGLLLFEVGLLGTRLRKLP